MSNGYRLTINVEETFSDDSPEVTHYSAVRILSKYRKHPMEAAITITRMIDEIVSLGCDGVDTALLDYLIDNLTEYRKEFNRRWR